MPQPQLDSGWELKEGKIVKSFQFPGFMKAIEFVNDVARIAEKVNHHPIITIKWKTVKLSLKSFDVDAITERDINLAKEIEKRLVYNPANMQSQGVIDYVKIRTTVVPGTTSYPYAKFGLPEFVYHATKRFRLDITNYLLRSNNVTPYW